MELVEIQIKVPALASRQVGWDKSAIPLFSSDGTMFLLCLTW